MSSITEMAGNVQDAVETVAGLGGDQQGETFKQADHKNGATAVLLLRTLGDDLKIGEEKQGLALEGLLEDTAVKKDDGSYDWGATADKFIKSFDAQVPDDCTRDENGKVSIVQAHGMSAETAKYLREVMTGAGDVSAKEMARVLKEANGPDKKQSLYEYLRWGNNLDDMLLTRDALQAFRDMLNQFVPGLGNTIYDFMVESGYVQDPAMEKALSADEGPAVNPHMELAYDAVTGTGMHALWGLEGEGYNYWKPPLNAEQQSAFFDGSGYNGGNNNFGPHYHFGGNSPYEQFPVQSFETMVVDRLETLGAVEFENEGQRQDFIDYAQAAIYGGVVGAQDFTPVIERFEQEGIISLPEEPAARAAAIERMVKEFEGQPINDAQKAGRDLQNFIAKDSEIEFGPKAFNEYGALRQYTIDQEFSAAFAHYVPVKDGREFAQRMENLPGVKGYSPPVSELAAADREEEQRALPRLDEEELAARHTQYELQSSPAGGAVTLEHDGVESRMEIGNQPPTDKFNHCAEGKNAVPCAFNQPEGPDPASNDADYGLPTWESVQSDIFKPAG